MAEIRTVEYLGAEIRYVLTYKNIKNINIRINRNCEVSVSANRRTNPFDVDAIVVKKGDFILKSIDKFSNANKHQIKSKNYIDGEIFYILGKDVRLVVKKAESVRISHDEVYLFLFVKNVDDEVAKKRIVDKYLKNVATKTFLEILEEVYPRFIKFNIPYPQLKSRSMKSRWGSCLVDKKIITLNTKLIHFQRSCIEYVIIHELCHLKHPNHSKEFYNFVANFIPNWKEQKDILNKNVFMSD